MKVSLYCAISNIQNKQKHNYFKYQLPMSDGRENLSKKENQGTEHKPRELMESYNKKFRVLVLLYLLF